MFAAGRSGHKVEKGGLVVLTPAVIPRAPPRICGMQMTPSWSPRRKRIAQRFRTRMLFRNRTTRRARNIDFDQRACTEGAVEARLSASTAGYVKLLLPPRQSRGNSHVGLGYADGHCGRPLQCPTNLDCFSYSSGYCEGRAHLASTPTNQPVHRSMRNYIR